MLRCPADRWPIRRRPLVQGARYAPPQPDSPGAGTSGASAGHGQCRPPQLGAYSARAPPGRRCPGRGSAGVRWKRDRPSGGHPQREALVSLAQVARSAARQLQRGESFPGQHRPGAPQQANGGRGTVAPNPADRSLTVPGEKSRGGAERARRLQGWERKPGDLRAHKRSPPERGSPVHAPERAPHAPGGSSRYRLHQPGTEHPPAYEQHVKGVSPAGLSQRLGLRVAAVPVLNLTPLPGWYAGRSDLSGVVA